MDPVWYSNKYGLMDEEIYDILWNECGEWFQVSQFIIIIIIREG